MSKKKAIIIAIIVVILLAIAFLYFGSINNKSKENTKNNQTKENTKNFTMQDVVDKNTGDIHSWEKTLDKKETEIKNILKNNIKYINDYYEAYKDSVSYISKYGFLYEVPSKKYITSEDLKGFDNVDNKNLDNSVLFLFLKPSDLKSFAKMDIPDSQNLELFDAYESKEGFYVMDKNEHFKIVNKDVFYDILNRYDISYSNPEKVEKNSSSYNSIVSILKQKTKFNEIDVRYLYQDRDYAVAIISPKKNPANICEYILERYSSNQYKIVVDNYQNNFYYKSYINNIVPDLNMNLVPNYNAYNSESKINISLNNIIEKMKEEKYISKSDLPVIFQNSLGNFAYFEFKSGKKILAYRNANDWEFNNISSFEETVSLMRSYEDDPPIIILKQY